MRDEEEKSKLKIDDFFNFTGENNFFYEINGGWDLLISL